MKRVYFLVYLALACACGFVLLVSKADASTAGAYENCAPDQGEQNCINRLWYLRATGVTRVINNWYWQSSDAQRLAYLDTADQLGMKVVIPTVPSGESVPAWHPGLWGFYLGEELPASSAPEINQRGKLYEAIWPDLKRMYVAWGMSDLGETLRPFKPCCDTLGADFYPYGVPYWDASWTENIAGEVRRIAGDKQPLMVLQAFSWHQEPTLMPSGANDVWPSVKQMRRQVNLSPGLHYWFSWFFADEHRDRIKAVESG